MMEMEVTEMALEVNEDIAVKQKGKTGSVPGREVGRSGHCKSW